MTADDRETQTQFDCIDDLKTYIDQHTDQPLNREQLAKMAGFSVPHFHRIFTAEVGENIAAYVRRVRLERAANKLIMGAVDLTQVALAAGYKSHAAFSVAFKQHYGLAPSEYRKVGFLTQLQILHKKKPREKQKGEPHDKD